MYTETWHPQIPVKMLFFRIPQNLVPTKIKKFTVYRFSGVVINNKPFVLLQVWMVKWFLANGVYMREKNVWATFPTPTIGWLCVYREVEGAGEGYPRVSILTHSNNTVSTVLTGQNRFTVSAWIYSERAVCVLQ